MLLSSFLVNNESTEWFIDSGASAHMSKNKSVLTNIRESMKKDVIVANNQKISVKCIGDIEQKIKSNGVKKNIVIRDVQYVPDICANLLSVSKIVQNNNTVIFNKNGCKIFDYEKNLIATGSLEHNMFKLDTVKVKSDYACNVIEKTNLWHRRLGHVSITNMNF